MVNNNEPNCPIKGAEPKFVADMDKSRNNSIILTLIEIFIFYKYFSI
jgi:hypothetical protein